MAVKDGLGPRPVSQTAKRHFLNRLETGVDLVRFFALIGGASMF